MNEKMVWGPSPFPVGAESLGIIKHPVDGMIGVLFKLPTGILAHGAAGVIRSIGQSPAAALGSIRTPKKAAASRENGKDQRPHILKLKHFESIFPHSLISNEWQDKFQIVINGRPTTYNPDYYCPALESYIEVTTSKPNISEQGPKWRQAIENGLNLRVYWWDGTDITVQFAASRENGKKGGRPPLTIDDRLRRDVLKAEARGEARVKQVRTPDGRTLEEITASILVPASIDRARAGKETGWTVGEWSVFRDTDGGVWSAR